MFMNGYFILLFALTPERDASEGHTSHHEQGYIRVELKFAKPLPEAITCLLYLEFDNSVLINVGAKRHDRLVKDGNRADTVHIAQCKFLP